MLPRPIFPPRPDVLGCAMLRAFLPVGYRNLRTDAKNLVGLGRINLLVGPNNSGKSNYIRALGFLRDMLLCDGGSTSFLQTVEKHGRAEVVNRTHGSKTRTRRLAFQWLLQSVRQPSQVESILKVQPSPRDLLYALSYVVGDSADFPMGFHVEIEELLEFAHAPIIDRRWSSARGKLLARRGGRRADQCEFGLVTHGKEPKPKLTPTLVVDVDTNETILKQSAKLLKDKQFYEHVYPEFSKTQDELLAFARGFHSYASTDLDVRQLAEGAKIDLSVRALDAEGSQFVNVLRYLDQKYDFLDEYAERLRELCPDLRKLKVIDASDTYKQLELNIGGHKYKPREMSDGTLKAMWLALLLFSPEKGSVLSIDEPEMNLHPAWLKVIGRWLQRFSSAEQLFVSTHSPDLLDTFTEGFKTGEVALFVFGLGDKEMRRVEPGELESFWKDGWELGDLYRVGEPKLGGWPW